MITETNEMAVLISAIIGGIVALLGPSVVIIVTSRTRSREKHEDWKRLDDVANKVEAAEVTRLVAIKDVSSSIQVLKIGQDEIHEIVNSRMTSKLERIEQLIETLVGAGIDVPDDPNPTD